MQPYAWLQGLNQGLLDSLIITAITLTTKQSSTTFVKHRLVAGAHKRHPISGDLKKPISDTSLQDTVTF